MASSPARVAGILTIMFGASASNRMACSTMAPAFRYRRGSVWIDKRPLRPRCLANAGISNAAASIDRASTAAQPMSSSVASGCCCDQGRDARPPFRHARLQHGVRDHRIARRAHAALIDAPAQLVEIGGVVPQTRRRGLVISCSGLFHAAPVSCLRIIRCSSSPKPKP